MSISAGLGMEPKLCELLVKRISSVQHDIASPALFWTSISWFGRRKKCARLCMNYLAKLFRCNSLRASVESFAWGVPAKQCPEEREWG